MDSEATDAIARFFDREACCAGPGRRGLSRVSVVLLRHLEQIGIVERSFLDAGCGTGGLTVALARQGATRVTGMDLSPGAIAQARREATAADLGNVEFAVGDAATAGLDTHDVVVLNKVACCYPDAGALVANTAPAAGAVLALSLPRSQGLPGALARLALSAENGWRRLRGDPFRAVVHDVDAVTERLAAAGLAPLAHRAVGIWHVGVYRRPAA